MRNLFFQILAGILGIWIATQFIPGVFFDGSLQCLLLAGLILGLTNFFIKPILNLITLPLRMFTFGLFGIVINIAIVWVVVDILFPGHLEIAGLKPLLLTTIIVWGLSYVLSIQKRR